MPRDESNKASQSAKSKSILSAVLLEEVDVPKSGLSIM